MKHRIRGALTTRSRGPVTSVAVLAVVALTLTTGGTAYSASKLPTTMKALVKQAKKEGQVNWSAPKLQKQMQGAIDLFEKKYPGITVNYSDTNAPTQVNQLQIEEAANKVSVDVAAAGGLTVIPSLKMANYVKWTNYGVKQIDSVFGNKMIYIWASPKVWVYNTKLLQAANVPKTWNDILHLSVPGSQIAIESRASFMSVWADDPTMGKTNGLAWAQQLTTLRPHWTSNTTQSEALVASGQAAFGTSLMNLVLKDEKAGAPVAIAPIPNTSTNETFIYVPKGAPHLAAAVLLSSFLSSPAAQAALELDYNSRIPRSTNCSNPGTNLVLKTLCGAGIKWYSTPTLAAYKSLNNYFPKAQIAMGTFIG